MLCNSELCCLLLCKEFVFPIFYCYYGCAAIAWWVADFSLTSACNKSKTGYFFSYPILRLFCMNLKPTCFVANDEKLRGLHFRVRGHITDPWQGSSGLQGHPISTYIAGRSALFHQSSSDILEVQGDYIFHYESSLGVECHPIICRIHIRFYSDCPFRDCLVHLYP